MHVELKMTDGTTHIYRPSEWEPINDCMAFMKNVINQHCYMNWASRVCYPVSSIMSMIVVDDVIVNENKQLQGERPKVTAVSTRRTKAAA